MMKRAAGSTYREDCVTCRLIYIFRRMSGLCYNFGTMRADPLHTLKAKVRAVHRLLIKAYGQPARPAWAGTVTPIERPAAAVDAKRAPFAMSAPRAMLAPF